MKSVFLVRHSFAEYSYSKSDFDRELSSEGYQQIAEQYAIIENKKESIDLIISSSAVRARQTAEDFEKRLKINNDIVFLDWLYNAYAIDDLIHLLQSISNTSQSVMLIAHNPTISAIANQFLPSTYYMFNPCGILKLTFEIDDWKQLNAFDGKEDYFLN